MLDARFPTYSPGSRRLADFELAGEHRLLVDEIDRTAGQSLGAGKARITKGQLTQAEARQLEATWRAIGADLVARASYVGAIAAGAATVPLPETLAALDRASGVTWTGKVNTLRREIEHRRSGQQAEIAKGRLTAADAKAQLERLEAVHDLYWRQGFAFDGTRDELRAMTAPILDFDVEQQGAATVRGDSSRAERPANQPADGGATPPPRSTASQEQAA